MFSTGALDGAVKAARISWLRAPFGRFVFMAVRPRRRWRRDGFHLRRLRLSRTGQQAVHSPNYEGELLVALDARLALI